jgi:hypothetical protein
MAYAAVAVALAIFMALIGRCLGPLSADQTPTPTLTAAPVVTRTPVPVVSTPVPAVSTPVPTATQTVAPTVQATATLAPPTPTVVAPTALATSVPVTPDVLPVEVVLPTPTPMFRPPPAPAQLPRRS